MEELRYKIKTEATFEAVDLDRLKRNLHIGAQDEDDNTQDEYLQEILEAVTDDVQTDIGRRLCQETWLGYLDDFPVENDDGNCEVDITLGPVIEVIGVQYYNSSNVKTVMSAADYTLDNTELTARLRFLNTYSVYSDRLNAVEIEFTTGYQSVGAVPKRIKDAIILLASDRYLNPENSTLNFGFSVRQSKADNMLRKFRVQRF
jgi:uncharacterized phiE125 gp8 family phage protein